MYKWVSVCVKCRSLQHHSSWVLFKKSCLQPRCLSHSPGRLSAFPGFCKTFPDAYFIGNDSTSRLPRGKLHIRREIVRVDEIGWNWPDKQSEETTCKNDRKREWTNLMISGGKINHCCSRRELHPFLWSPHMYLTAHPAVFPAMVAHAQNHGRLIVIKTLQTSRFVMSKLQTSRSVIFFNRVCIIGSVEALPILCMRCAR